MVTDAQGRLHEPKGIPTGGQYAAGSTGHGVTDDLPAMPADLDEASRVEAACNDWLARPHGDDSRMWRMEDGEVRDGHWLREMFAGQVEDDPDAYCDDPGELDQRRLDDEYRVWLREHEYHDMIEAADPVAEGMGDHGMQRGLRLMMGGRADDLRSVDFDLPDGTTLRGWALDGGRVDRDRLPAGWHAYSVTEDETDEPDPAWGGAPQDAPYRTVMGIRERALVNHRMDILTTRSLDLGQADVFVDGDEWGFGDDRLASTDPYDVGRPAQERADDALRQLERDDDERAADRVMADYGQGRDAFSNACIRSTGLDDLPMETIDLMRERADRNAYLAERADNASPAHAYHDTFKAFADFRRALGK